MKSDIPVTSLQRLPVYLNYLKTLNSDGYISSGAIARALDMGEVLVRKDLAYTSAQGRTRVGYSLKELISAIEDYLGCNDVKEAVIVGAGELGNALLSYGGFVNYGIELAAAFDNDPVKIGKEIAGKPVYDFAEAENVIKKRRIKLAVLCVPASVAQAAADKLIGCGVERILNFAPVLIKAADSVTVRNIDVAANLAILSSM
ncbi:MAG: redox-sensing transcriptional repressor Rex [Clostridia bacterium]|jgi:redox-sensing transcriptional repressor|nr:redox-sensing transcriptional repressor Rex [Clostridia bacterium]